MTEKLYRHIAEMWAVRSDDECIYEYCVFCDATVESTITDDDGNLIDQEVEHAPGCWYVWCCEWVKKRDGFRRAKGVLPWKEGDELPEDTIRRLRDEQNTGDEDE